MLPARPFVTCELLMRPILPSAHPRRRRGTSASVVLVAASFAIAALPSVAAAVGQPSVSRGAETDRIPWPPSVRPIDFDPLDRMPATEQARSTSEHMAGGAETDRVEARIALLTATYRWDERGPRVAELQRALGVNDHGWYADNTRIVHLAALTAMGLPLAGVPARPPGPSSTDWAELRACESGGDYSIVSASGRYRGAYQFNRSTWDVVAGRHAPELVGVDPAAAAPADQDAMARALFADRGASPWPHCGRHLR